MSARRWHWYGLDHEPISAREADELLADVDSRRIGFDLLVIDGKAVEVSTVFLVLNHEWDDRRPPLLYETLVRADDELGAAVQRYSTRPAALAGHDRVLARLKSDGLPSR